MEMYEMNLNFGLLDLNTTNELDKFLHSKNSLTIERPFDKESSEVDSDILLSLTLKWDYG